MSYMLKRLYRIASLTFMSQSAICSKYKLNKFDYEEMYLTPEYIMCSIAVDNVKILQTFFVIGIISV